MKRWIDPILVQVPQALQDFVGGHPLVAETLVRRGVTTVAAAKAFLDPNAYTPASPSEFSAMGQAVTRIAHAIQHKESICVWGDFDVDGQTATTLLVSTLRDLGANVTYHIPVRETESHGINVPQLQTEIEKGTQLFLTCDTGIAAMEGIAYAKAHAVDTIITDHHEPPPELPPAHAILNPHLLPHGHPLQTLPGVGVAYKLSEALYEWAKRPGDAVRHLDLVALGIVADVALQTNDTRYLLQRGLEILRQTQRLGLQELMRWANLNPSGINSEDIGFGLAPRLNAVGRLDDANIMVEFLTTADLARARILASQLEAINAKRKMLCDQVFAAACKQIEQKPELLDDAALVISHPTWPAGVIGIVANRLVEKYHRPAILFTGSPEGLVRGSARSIAGCHITEAITALQDIVTNFGGHEMAAGLALPQENLESFRKRLSDVVAEQLGKTGVQPTRAIDCYMALSDLTMAFIEDINRLAPFGAGNPSLCFATRHVKIKNHRSLGRDGNHLTMTLEDAEGVTRKVVWWQWNGAPLPDDHFDLAYSLRINDFRGVRQLQIVWEEAREIQTAPVVITADTTLDIIDYRKEPHPLTLLKPLQMRGDVQIWCEGSTNANIAGQTRCELDKADALVIWTAPPGPSEIQAAVAQVSPRTLYLFQEAPGLDLLKPFLTHLTGLVKHGFNNYEGQIPLSKLAAMVAHRESTVRLGLAWLEAQGYLKVTATSNHILHIEPQRSSPNAQRTAQIVEQLSAALIETRAFRNYFSRTDIGNIREMLLAAES
ncbi:MAG: single-stranded-DNA-specific exonuclease RecJ [Anaerolineae bacterium]|nr:single-stranded-DNA-specific exonuclease RecJ [Anaerolineae bacterium]